MIDGHDHVVPSKSLGRYKSIGMHLALNYEFFRRLLKTTRKIGTNAST